MEPWHFLLPLAVFLACGPAFDWNACVSGPCSKCKDDHGIKPDEVPDVIRAKKVFDLWVRPVEKFYMEHHRMPSVEEVDLGEFREKYRDILRGPYFDTMFPQYPNDPYLLRFVAIGKPCDIACRYKIGNWHEAEEETAGASGAPPKQWRMRERFGWEPVHEGKGWGCFVVLTEHFHHGEILKY